MRRSGHGPGHGRAGARARSRGRAAPVGKPRTGGRRHVARGHVDGGPGWTLTPGGFAVRAAFERGLDPGQPGLGQALCPNLRPRHHQAGHERGAAPLRAEGAGLTAAREFGHASATRTQTAACRSSGDGQGDGQHASGGSITASATLPAAWGQDRRLTRGGGEDHRLPAGRRRSGRRTSAAARAAGIERLIETREKTATCVRVVGRRAPRRRPPARRCRVRRCHFRRSRHAQGRRAGTTWGRIAPARDSRSAASAMRIRWK